MLIVMKKGCGRGDVDLLLRRLESMGLEGQVVSHAGTTAVAVLGTGAPTDPTPFDLMPGVLEAIPVRRSYSLAGRDTRVAPTVVRIGQVSVGGGAFALIAGPCAVESERQLLETARLARAHGADVLRGGAYKPRSSPYSFQGMGPEGLDLLVRARAETGLPFVTEALDEGSLARVSEVADAVQIGARNMGNTALLRRAGRCGRPILLKRGFAATLEEWLLAAEYVLAEGNSDVILCERGIRTFSAHSRYTLDLSVVPAARELSHLPIAVDPSHGTGRRDRVPAMARAALAAGADAVMVEVHPEPASARSDGPQALLPDTFAALAADLKALASWLEQRREVAR